MKLLQDTPSRARALLPAAGRGVATGLVGVAVIAATARTDVEALAEAVRRRTEGRVLR